MAFIISADEFKKSLPGYEPARSEEFHRESARLADKAYAIALKERPEQSVILMSGGAASGKSEYVSAYLEPTDCIVVDGTLPTLLGAKNKIRQAQKADKPVEIHAVMPEDFTVAYSAFLNRERKFSDEHFFRTHSQSRNTLYAIAKEYPDLPIKVIMSEYDPKNQILQFSRVIFHNQQRQLEFIELIAYTEEYIRNKVFRNDAA